VNKKTYELIEHTADIGIKVKAKSLKTLFIKASQAVFSIIAKEKTSAARKLKKINLKLKSDALSELFVDYLNELLFLSSNKGLIFKGFKINKLKDCSLQATLTGYCMDDFKINCEIKAATYHGLKIEKYKGSWIAEVIFDV